jgi:hypothetical protein
VQRVASSRQVKKSPSPGGPMCLPLGPFRRREGASRDAENSILGLFRYLLRGTTLPAAIFRADLSVSHPLSARRGLAAIQSKQGTMTNTLFLPADYSKVGSRDRPGSQSTMPEQQQSHREVARKTSTLESQCEAHLPATHILP